MRNFNAGAIRFCKLLAVSLIILISCKKDLKQTDLTDEVQSKAHPDSKKEDKDARLGIDWYNLHLRMILHANPAISNIVVIRNFGYAGLAFFESARFINEHSRSMSGQVYLMPAMPSPDMNRKYSWLLAGNAAFADITRKMFPGLTLANNLSIDSLENAYNVALGSHLSSDEFNRSRAFGLAISQAIFDWSKTDNFNHANDPYVIPVFPGSWEKTPPAFANPAVPYMGKVRPFIAEDTGGVAPPVLFSYSENPSSGFYKMVKDIYDVSHTMTTDQRNMALFWDDLGVDKGYTPPGHAISVLNQVLQKEHVGMGKAIEAYLKAGMGMWDGAIMVFRSKYTYNLVRPVTYIRKVIDASWSPLIVTPPHPEYPAAHAYITSSTMVGIADVLGDYHFINDTTYNFLGYPARQFHTLSAVGVESGMSRRFGGIHYLPSILVGIALGQKVGRAVGKIHTSSKDDRED